MPERTEQRLEDHIKEADKNFRTFDRRLTRIEENHLFHIEKDISKLKTDIASMRAKLEMQGKFMWIQITTIIGGFTGMIFTLVKLL